MPDAAHPQLTEPESAPAPVKNPFPERMHVPGLDGETVTIELAVVDGVVYAPGLDQAAVSPPVRQYVTQYCAAWSSSVVTAEKLEASWPEPPRRARVVFGESQLHVMLGLAPDERLLRVIVNPEDERVEFVVESPRLPRQVAWDTQPPFVTLPIAAFYEVAGR